MIADEGFSKCFNKCLQNIQMNFSFSHTVLFEVHILHKTLGCKNGQVYRSMVILIKSYEALESLFRKFLEIELGLRARQAC